MTEDLLAGEGPRVWLLLSDKLGDNAQARVLAAATGLPFEERRLVVRPEWVWGKPRFEATLDHLDLARSDPLAPPWPDLVVTIGRRCAMAALWVRRQSGGRTRLVWIGRPRRGFDEVDLVVAPPQFLVPDHPKVVRLDLPLMRADPERVAEARERFRDRLAGLPRPLTAVLVGGATKPFRFDRAVARSLARGLAELREREGGTLYVTTSRRTREEAVESLARELPDGAILYRFRPDDPDNPYPGLLAHADRFVVTGDSVSMMVEVARLGRPLAIFDLPLVHDPLERLKLRLGAPLQPGRTLGRLGDRLRERGLLGVSRDLRAFHRRLYTLGLAVPLGEPFRPPRPVADDDLRRAAARVRQLVADLPATPAAPGASG
jgi:mitochondrial fission protein ELM1